MPHTNDGQPSPGSAAYGDQNAGKRVSKLFKVAHKRHELWRPQWEECYRYSLPGRLQFNEQPGSDSVTGEIYDETAVVELPRFASRMVNGMFPPNMESFSIEPGPDHQNPKRAGLQAELDQLSKALHDSLWTSAFHAELHEANHDLAIGTGNLYMEPGIFPGQFRFTSIPLTDIAIMNGIDEKPGQWFRSRKVKLEDIRKIWPKAEIPSSIMSQLKSDPGKEYDVIVSCIKEYKNDGVERGTFNVVLEKEETSLLERTYEGLGSLPFITYRWNTSPGESYGRGPLLNVMPAVITANLVVELVLQNAQIALGGIWTYDHDGVFNPDNIVLEPGTFIPKARGSDVQSLVSSNRFDVSQLVLDDMRRNIRSGLFSPGSDRPQGRTPPSATEIADDNAQLAEDMGAVTGRLAMELLYRVVQRGIWIYNQQGLFGNNPPPRIDGRQYKVVPKSPLLRAQNQHDINNFSRYMGQLGASIGPLAGVAIPPEKQAHYLAKLHNIPAELLPSETQLRELIKRFSQQASQQPQ